MGTYFSVEHNECVSCWLGSYQDQEGQVECKSCPEGSSTAYLHSRSISECKGKIDFVQLVTLRVWILLRAMLFQDNASLALTPRMDWRSASRARWVTTSLVTQPGIVSSVPKRPRRSPEEQWTRRSAEVRWFIPSPKALSTCLHSSNHFEPLNAAR